MMNIILFGAPGCGKGTQSSILAKKFNLLQVTLGDILRKYRNEKDSPFSEEISKSLDSGKLLPDDLVNKVAHDFSVNNASNYSGILFDGYPRSINQAEFVDQMLKNDFNSSLTSAIFMEIAFEDVAQRLQNRYMCKKCGEIYNKMSKNTRVRVFIYAN